MGARIASMALRLFFVLNLVLGLYFWITGNTGLVDLHMLIGILFVISLWVYSALVGLQTGSVGFVAGCFALGLLIVIVGVTQESILEGTSHWLVQILHLLLAIIAIGIAEVFGARAQRAAKIRAA